MSQEQGPIAKAIGLKPIQMIDHGKVDTGPTPETFMGFPVKVTFATVTDLEPIELDDQTKDLAFDQLFYDGA